MSEPAALDPVGATAALSPSCPSCHVRESGRPGAVENRRPRRPALAPRALTRRSACHAHRVMPAKVGIQGAQSADALGRRLWTTACAG